jgi:hypothetical protein
LQPQVVVVVYGTWQGFTSDAFKRRHGDMPMTHQWLAIGPVLPANQRTEAGLREWLTQSSQIDPGNVQYFLGAWDPRMIYAVEGVPHYQQTLDQMRQFPV